MDFGASICDLDPEEYEQVVMWVRDLQEAEARAARGESDDESIDMDEVDWSKGLGR